MSRRADIDTEIDAITEELEALTVEFTRRRAAIVTRLSTLRRHRDNTITTPVVAVEVLSDDEDRPLSRGDLAEITNNYRGNRGVRGRVIRVGSRRVTIIDDNGIEHTRAPHNLRRIQRI